MPVTSSIPDYWLYLQTILCFVNFVPLQYTRVNQGVGKPDAVFRGAEGTRVKNTKGWKNQYNKKNSPVLGEKRTVLLWKL
ncbi:MAG: hypothetical protein ACTS8P_01760 [Arsenophonus sp. NC-XBC3-MAG3]